ncbi:MAG: ABC transporter substrate-binding protein [Nocardioides sp.]|uniref:heme/hemin ABC transporter substrate-binding protein n=1 Tax=Nocardioides sp. TaxID=35761 RepID=UPI0039E4893F
MSRLVRNRATTVCAAVLALVLSACGAASTSSGGAGAGSGGAAVKLANAKILDDPRSYEGPTHAGLAGASIDPIATNPVQHLPVTVTDSQGTEVTVKDTSRILALDLYGTLSQTVFDLGLGDDVVGRDLSTQFKEARKLPLVTGEHSHELIAERITELNPSVIITDTSLGPWDVILQMRDAGIPVVVVSSHRGIDNIGSLTEQVADALGVTQAGKRLAKRSERQVAATEKEIKAVAPQTVQKKLRMVFLYVRGQAGVYYMFGEGSGADSLIDGVGGYDVAKEINWKGMKPVTDEGIVAAQPDLILMMTKGLDSVGGVDGLLKRLPAIADTPAGQKRRIVDMSDAAILGFGPRTPEVLNSLAVSIYAPESAIADAPGDPFVSTTADSGTGS